METDSPSVMLEQLNEDYAQLREDAEAWREGARERRLWETTLMDGLADP